MAAVYLDTSALGRILLGEPDGPEVRRALGRFEHHLASRLLRVELRRLAARTGTEGPAEQLLAGVALLPLDEALLSAAETVAPPGVATLDAIHLATALRLRDADALDAVMTYDRRLADGARHHGLPVVAPAV